MLDQVDGPRLVEEARYRIAILRVLREQHLHRDASANRFLNRFIHRAHPALPKRSNNAIRPKLLRHPHPNPSQPAPQDGAIVTNNIDVV